jgi:hypothetical protein
LRLGQQSGVGCKCCAAHRSIVFHVSTCAAYCTAVVGCGAVQYGAFGLSLRRKRRRDAPYCTLRAGANTIVLAGLRREGMGRQRAGRLASLYKK